MSQSALKATFDGDRRLCLAGYRLAGNPDQRDYLNDNCAEVVGKVASREEHVVSQKPEDSPKTDESQNQEQRWSLADGPTFVRSLPDDATEEEKADFVNHPWFYNWFASDDAPTTFAVNLYPRSNSPTKAPELDSQQSTPEPNTDDDPHIDTPGSVKPTQNK